MASIANRDEMVEYLTRLTSNDSQPSRVRVDVEDDLWNDVVDRAIEKYSDDKPKTVRREVNGDGTVFRWVLEDTIPSSEFSQTFSTLVDVRVSDDDTDTRTEELLVRDDDYTLEQDSSDKHVVTMLHRTPGATENIVFYFTIQHTITDITTSIPLRDRRAVADLAASYVYEMYADRAASDFDVETGESGDISDLASIYESRAEKRLKMYNSHIRNMSEGPAPVGSVESWRSEHPISGPRFSHNQRRRGER